MFADRKSSPSKSLVSGVSVSEYECCCCYELMVDPTSLNCGHSLCRHCLAQWFLQSKKRECPSCKQVWTGYPRVNIIVRNTIEKLFRKQIQERKDELLLDSNIQTSVQLFDQKLSESSKQGSSEDSRWGFCSGMMFSLFAALMIYLAWYWGHADYDLLVHKPIQHWKVTDVAQWLTELGTWAEPYAEQALHYQIDGSLLLSIEEDNIDTIFNFTTPLHNRAVLVNLNMAKTLGVKPPHNIWDFKAVYRGRALFLAYSMKDFPRLTLLYSYFFAYDEVFAPFVHFTCPNENFTSEELNVGQIPPLSWSQWSQFLLRLLVIPYFLIINFTWQWLDVHYWTSRIVIINCASLTVLEFLALRRFIRTGWRTWYSGVGTYVKAWLFMGFITIIWPLIPAFVCDCIFYMVLYYSPYVSLETLYRQIV